MSQTNICFLHGLESGPHGGKYKALTRAYPMQKIGSIDFTSLPDLQDRVDLAMRTFALGESWYLVGSSLGGLVALLVAERMPEKIKGLVLCAPALHKPEAQLLTRVPYNTHIIHGIRDDVVPLQASQFFASEWGCELLEVQDGHRLKDSTPQILGLVQKMLHP